MPEETAPETAPAPEPKKEGIVFRTKQYTPEELASMPEHKRKRLEAKILPEGSPNDREFTVGEEVESIYGEKLTVLNCGDPKDENDVQPYTDIILKKNKKPLGIVERRIKAMSGDHPTWFPAGQIKP